MSADDRANDMGRNSESAVFALLTLNKIAIADPNVAEELRAALNMLCHCPNLSGQPTGGSLLLLEYALVR